MTPELARAIELEAQQEQAAARNEYRRLLLLSDLTDADRESLRDVLKILGKKSGELAADAMALTNIKKLEADIAHATSDEMQEKLQAAYIEKLEYAQETDLIMNARRVEFVKLYNAHAIIEKVVNSARDLQQSLDRMKRENGELLA